MSPSLVVQQAATPPDRLFLLFHGVGANAQTLEPLGRELARAFPTAMVVCVDAPFESDLGAGRQWFSVQGVTEANRPLRVAVVMPSFVATVHDWQARAHIEASRTVLVGFSQGGIMALAATQLDETLAGTVVSLSGRFPETPRHRPAATRIHLLHGEHDQVIPAQASVAAAQALEALGAEVSLDLLPGLGHSIDRDEVQRLLSRLRG